MTCLVTTLLVRTNPDEVVVDVTVAVTFTLCGCGAVETGVCGTSTGLPASEAGSCGYCLDSISDCAACATEAYALLEKRRLERARRRERRVGIDCQIGTEVATDFCQVVLQVLISLEYLEPDQDRYA